MQNEESRINELRSQAEKLRKLIAADWVEDHLKDDYRQGLALIEEQLRASMRPEVRTTPTAPAKLNGLAFQMMEPDFDFAKFKADQKACATESPSLPSQERQAENGVIPERAEKSQPAPNRTANTPRQAVPTLSRASLEALPPGKRQLPGYFRKRFNEAVELEYTQKGLYHLLPEFRTFQRAVEHYRDLCQYWNIDVTPADVDLSWSRLSEDNQKIRRRVWEEIVKAAKATP
jgi:hypothetical protein